MKDRDVITTNSLANTTLGWFSNRTGALVDDGARKSNNRAAHWQRKSRLVVSARFPVVNWRSRSVAKSAHAKVGFAWAVTSHSFAVRALFTQSPAVGGYFQKNWAGLCSTLPETLTLFQTKIWDFPYPISDLILESIPYFRPALLISSLGQTNVKSNVDTLWLSRIQNCTEVHYYGTYPVGLRPKGKWSYRLMMKK